MKKKILTLPHFLKIIKPPGGGILTFTTGSEKARRAMNAYFKKSTYESWTHYLTNSPYIYNGWILLGVPSDCGGGVCRGAAHGPLGIRTELFKKDNFWKFRDLGDIPCIPHLLEDSMLSGSQKKASGESLWGKNNYYSHYPVSPLNLTEEFLFLLLSTYKNLKPLVLGGDHSISGAVFNAMSRSKRLKNCGVIHFDAHTDLLESRFGVENCFATWTSHALKKISNPQNWIQLGIRASGQKKIFWEKKYRLKQYWAHELNKKDPILCAQEISKGLKERGCTRLYISNDIDGTDSHFACSTGTPESGGLHPLWVKKVIREFSRSFEIIGADIMEVAPVIGSQLEAQKTLKTAVSYIHALGSKGDQ